MTAPLHRPLLRSPRALAAAALLVAAVAAPLVAAGSATAASNPQAEAAATWLAGRVGADGSVDNPYAPGTPSLTWTTNVALSLAATGNQPDVLRRAIDHVAADVPGYIAEGTSDPAGRLSWLILLVKATGGDPRAFGSSSTDLVAALQARYGVAQAGLYGVIDEYTPVTNQALAILALTAAGETPPAAAVEWLRAQQCTAPASAAGAWEGYRAPSGGGLAACADSVSSDFTSADSNSTAFAVQALAALGDTTAVPSALTWLSGMQVATGPAAGGFGQRPGDVADPNSTAVVVQALVAAGEDPASGTWQVGGGTPMSSLRSWIVTSGADAGALASPYSGGAADLFATHQAVWGLAGATFPLPVVPLPTPPSTSVPPTEGPSAVDAGNATAEAVAPVVVTPAFTG